MPGESVDIFGLPLGEYLEATTEFADESRSEGITNDDEALWTMRKLAQAARQMSTITRQADAEIERIETWRRANVVGFEEVVEVCERLLGDYLVRVREDSADGRKMLTFPDGTVSSRIVADRAVVENVPEFIVWAKAGDHTEWVRVKEEVSLANIKGNVDLDAANSRVLMAETGEVIPGLSVIPGGISTSIRLAD
jgi:Bacteriophage Mu Gam like protein